MAKQSIGQSLVIPAPNIELQTFKIKGLTPLIFHKWSEKAKKMMLDKQQKKATKGSKNLVRNPQKEYKESFYYNSKGKIAFPATWIKQSIVGSARNIDGVAMTLLRGAVFVVGDKEGLIDVKYKKKRMREDMVRIGMGTADLRYRGELSDWEADVSIKYNADVISLEQVANLLRTAGFSCGIGEWRPEKNGDFGQFDIVGGKK